VSQSQRRHSDEMARGRPNRSRDKHEATTRWPATPDTPANSISIQRLQATAGNQVVVEMLRRSQAQHDGGATPVAPISANPVGGLVRRKREAGTYKGTFDGNQMRIILDDSQGRDGTTGAAGHVREHVKDASETRVYAKAEQKMKTCFVNDAQQNVGTKEALNTSAGQTELAKLDTLATNRVVIKDALISRVNAWQSEWDAAANDSKPAAKIHATKMTVIVDKRFGNPLAVPGAPEVHVQTSYPQDG
jgi:hypothetical protein